MDKKDIEQNVDPVEFTMAGNEDKAFELVVESWRRMFAKLDAHSKTTVALALLGLKMGPDSGGPMTVEEFREIRRKLIDNGVAAYNQLEDVKRKRDEGDPSSLKRNPMKN